MSVLLSLGGQILAMAHIRFYLDLVYKNSESPCIMALYNGGSKAHIQLQEKGKSCLGGTVRQRRPVLAQRVPLESQRLVISDYLFNKTARAASCMVGVAPKEILSLVFNPVSLKILDFYLEMWLWWPHMCGKNPSLGSGYIRFRDHRDFRIYVYF